MDATESGQAVEAAIARPYGLHAIQLKELRVSELSVLVDLEAERKEADAGGEFTMEVGRTEFDAEQKHIQVRLCVRIGHEEGQEPQQAFRMTVEVHGVFEVDDERFDPQHIPEWADKNAPLILYPYVREHVYGLATRAGLKGVFLPLLEVPTYKISAPTTKN